MVIDIIGAGIGGLTTAIALSKKGIHTRVFEQAEEIKPIGAGIILANNAMQVYEKLGLKEEIEKYGNPISSLKITKPNLRPLSKIDLTYFERKYQTKNIAIHRGILQQLLLNRLGKTELYVNHQLSSITEDKEATFLHFSNGKQIHSSVTLGADGINSKVREFIYPNIPIRKANQLCLRGVIDFELPEQFRHELNESWGTTERFGFVQIEKNKVYWYALKSFEKSPNEFSFSQLEDSFSNYHPLILEIIKSSNKEQVNTAEIADLTPTDKWFKNNICLIGDAIHATTPNIGQGACQAIEDAYVIAECLNKYNINTAFSTYKNQRIEKAHQVVKTSWVIGKMAHPKKPLLANLRNQLLKITPSSLSKKQNERIFQLTST